MPLALEITLIAAALLLAAAVLGAVAGLAHAHSQKERAELGKAIEDFQVTLGTTLLPLVKWLNRQLQRLPQRY